MMKKNWFKEVNSKIDDYNIINLCEAMQVAYHKISAEIYLLNLRDCLGWLVRDKGYKLVRWTHKDIDFNKINVIPDNHHAKDLRAPYGLHVGKYHKGLAKVSWILYPGGQYYTSDDGFDVTDNTETVIYALIDKKGRIVERFQPDDNWLNR